MTLKFKRDMHKTYGTAASSMYCCMCIYATFVCLILNYRTEGCNGPVEEMDVEPPLHGHIQQSKELDIMQPLNGQVQESEELETLRPLSGQA